MKIFALISVINIVAYKVFVLLCAFVSSWPKTFTPSSLRGDILPNLAQKYLVKKYKPLFLSLLSGLLLWLSWPVSPFTFLIFIAFIPFLWMEYNIDSQWRFIFCTYMMLLIWNTGTTWWMCNSTLPGGIAALLANSLLMTIPFLGFHVIKKRMGESAGYLSLVVCWLTFEYMHLNWQLSWPWLTLGNVFASHPNWVQWYQHTGTSGGSLWILVVNILLFLTFRKKKDEPAAFAIKLPVASFLLLLLPFLVSYVVKPRTSNAPPNSRNVIVVQPNIDPYGKFESVNVEAQLQLLIKLSADSIDANTAVVVWPETAISFPGGIEEHHIMQNTYLLPVWKFLRDHRGIKLLSGIETYSQYLPQEKTASSRRINSPGRYRESYNTAALFDSSGVLQLYHKSKFVPGVETLPTYLRFLDKWFEDFGGTTGGYVPQAERTVLTDSASGYKFAPAICYESIYGEFLTEYIRNGANLIAIITNDGWWQNTAGYKQHMQYARLRAIETRRWVLRSANTGISCLISPTGEVTQSLPWDTAAIIKMTIPQNNTHTFYVKHGDVLSKIAEAVTIILLLVTTFVWVSNRFFK